MLIGSNQLTFCSLGANPPCFRSQRSGESVRVSRTSPYIIVESVSHKIRLTQAVYTFGVGLSRSPNFVQGLPASPCFRFALPFPAFRPSVQGLPLRLREGLSFEGIANPYGLKIRTLGLLPSGLSFRLRLRPCKGFPSPSPAFSGLPQREGRRKGRRAKSGLLWASAFLHTKQETKGNPSAFPSFDIKIPKEGKHGLRASLRFLARASKGLSIASASGL